MSKKEKKVAPLNEVQKPSLTLLVKLGSIAVHVDEMLSDEGHEFDRTALQQLLQDAEVLEWIGKMDKLAMLPKKRDNWRVTGKKPK